MRQSERLYPHNRRGFANPRIVVCVPSGSTAVERRFGIYDVVRFDTFWLDKA